MREPVDAGKVRRFFREFGRRVDGPGRVYVTGGGSAVLIGWRHSTIDLDLKFDPEPPGAFEALPRLKEELGINIELAAPDQFIPPVPGWRERSRFVERQGKVDFFHYDFLGQALSKVERGHEQDLKDVREMLARNLVTAAEMKRAFEELRRDLGRYPALDAASFQRKVGRALADFERGRKG